MYHLVPMFGDQAQVIMRVQVLVCLFLKNVEQQHHARQAHISTAILAPLVAQPPLAPPANTGTCQLEVELVTVRAQQQLIAPVVSIGMAPLAQLQQLLLLLLIVQNTVVVGTQWIQAALVLTLI